MKIPPAPTDTESIQIHIHMECERIVKMVIKVIAMKFYECLNQFSVNIRSVIIFYGKMKMKMKMTNRCGVSIESIRLSLNNRLAIYSRWNRK